MEAFTFGFDMPNLFTSGPALNNFIDASVLPDFPAVNYTKVDFSAVDIRALILELERGLKEYNTSHHATYCCSLAATRSIMTLLLMLLQAPT